MRTYTIRDFEKQFPNDDACLDFIFRARWPKGVTCEKCQKATPHYRITGRKVYSCQFCGTQVAPTADTIFHKSETPLRSWFYAIFLVASTRTGVSAKQLQRELGVTYKTAWRIMSQVRTLMEQDSPFLFGTVEADETYIGGKRPGKRGRGAAGKSVVFGMVNRDTGEAVAQVVPNVKAKTLLPIIEQHVSQTSTIHTDELMSYQRLTMMGYKHEAVIHAARQYVHGTAHVNNVEALWSNVKRGIDGVHHSVSPQHLQSYLDSYVFRYNNRRQETPMFSLMLNQIPSRLIGMVSL
jgi:transposase-like protein